jgi:uncharacterized membrane protein
MEWGKGSNTFVFSIYRELFFVQKDFTGALTHPIILPGISGQLILLICIIQKSPNRLFNSISVLLLLFVVLILLMAGIASTNMKMIFSDIPFVILSIIYFRKGFRKLQPN